jgi:hypothetical protein
MASFNLNYLTGVPPSDTIAGLGFHPVYTSQWVLNFNMSFDGDTQTLASIDTFCTQKIHYDQ